jgi:hypothetical protein
MTIENRDHNRKAIEIVTGTPTPHPSQKPINAHSEDAEMEIVNAGRQSREIVELSDKLCNSPSDLHRRVTEIRWRIKSAIQRNLASNPKPLQNEPQINIGFRQSND